MNPNLAKLQPYPFEKLRKLVAGVSGNASLRPINLSIGEPKHATPEFIKQTLAANLNGLASYPTTAGSDSLRAAIADWLVRRYGLATAPRVLPVNGTREALFAFAQTIIDASKPSPLVVCPNPFYQIYEGAALLAGAQVQLIPGLAQNAGQPDWAALPAEIWQRTQLVYVCSPGNPTGRVVALDEWARLFDLSERYGFVIASDECYSEIFFDRPPLGALEAARELGRDERRLVVFSSLSKRSNVPGMRSGFVAGDPELLDQFLLYRTYHGSAMSPAVQAASAAAWGDELHVEENRQLYRDKFAALVPLLAEPMQVSMPDAGFYLWARTPIADTEFTVRLVRDYNVQVLPGSFLARTLNGINPGENMIRIALVAPLGECIEAAHRMVQLIERL